MKFVYQVVNIDWREDNVIAEFDDKKRAEDLAERLDGLALRATVVVKKLDETSH